MNREHLLRLLTKSEVLVESLQSFNNVLNDIIEEVKVEEVDTEEDCGGYRGDGGNDPDNKPRHITSDYAVQPCHLVGYCPIQR